MSGSTTKLIEVSVRIIKAFLTRNAVAPEAVPGLLRAVHGTFHDLERKNKPLAPAKPPIPIEQTISKDFIISLEDGKPYISLKHHLRARGLTPETYRKKWGLAPQYPMVALSYSERRSAAAIAQGLGRKTRPTKQTPTRARA